MAAGLHQTLRPRGRMARAGVILALVAVASPMTASSAHAIEPFTDGTAGLVNNSMTSGVAMGITDMNNDGLDDIVRLDEGEFLEIEYQQPDGSFERYDFGEVGGRSWSLSLGDVNNDGYTDIFTGGRYNGLKVLTASADGTAYTSVLLGTPPDTPGFPPGVFLQCSNFADIDNDGSLDIFACHDNGLSAPYSNDGTGEFTHDPGLISAVSTIPSDNSGNYGSVWSDYDNDGDLDLYIAKCSLGNNDPFSGERTNLLFRNEGGGNWTEVAESAGLRPLAQSWSLDFGDIDNDGDFDAFLINHDQLSILYRNDGPGAALGTFTEITASAGIAADIGGLGNGIQTHFEDFDNDGFVDLLVTGNDGQHRLYMNNGDLTFTRAADTFPTGGLGMQSAVVGDLNNDGQMDVLAGFAFGYNSPSDNPDRLLLNPGNDNNWIAFRLHGDESNRSAVGARIEITGPWGTQVREVRAGESYGISNTLMRHFGLGSAEAFDTVTISWPSGQVDTFDYAAVNTVHDVTEGCLESFYADADGDGFGDARITAGGCVAPEGYVVLGTDCDDDDENNFPGNPEICDTADNNCNGEADEDVECSGTSTGGSDTGDSGDGDSGGDAQASAGGAEDTGGTSGVVTTLPEGDDSGTGDGTSGAGADDDSDDGCGCRSSSGRGGAGWLGLLVVPLVLRRRRRGTV